ncbi:hypothetical protein AMATHDRAFT_11066 [Amanita thiersii Skay4041]|uniref:Uncharacterized protein n=1 Tax=Amanita thiersii Skay4041 TaxID=703135 RepID=A0A2A9NAS1_9AGAR|nr:hypothetical protein AMATHDRAFT_11066 [Amanita thiersii Skay4041]
MFAALGKINILLSCRDDREAGQLDHSHVVDVRGKGRDILQKVLQERSGSDGLYEPIGGRLWDGDLEVVDLSKNLVGVADDSGELTVPHNPKLLESEGDNEGRELPLSILPSYRHWGP